MKNFERSEALAAEVEQLNQEFSQIVKNHVQARLKIFNVRVYYMYNIRSILSEVNSSILKNKKLKYFGII